MPPLREKVAILLETVSPNLKLCFSFLIPSFLREKDLHDNVISSQQDLRPTAYLDGLKGLFATIVYIRHYSIPWNSHIDLDYRQSPAPSFFQLPIVRILYSGPTLPVFFAVSGYVLSVKPMKLIRSGSNEKLYNHLASGIFQRGIKLFGPPVISTLIVLVFFQLGFYSFDYDSMPGAIPTLPNHEPTFALQIYDWCEFFSQHLTNIWTWQYQVTTYDDHLWSIPVQYRCSMILYTMLIGLSRLRYGYRTFFALFFAMYSMWIGRWEVFVYVVGMVLGEYETSIQEHQSESQSTSRRKSNYSILVEIFYLLGFILALLLASFPRSPGGNMLVYSVPYGLTEKYTVWHSCGTIIMLLTIPRSRVLHYIFTSSCLLYLGTLSFSIYLVHGPVLHLVGYRLVVRAADLFQKTPGEGFPFALSFLTVFLIVVWIADLFKRVVQTGCVRFSGFITKTVWND
jgi:peptidoglycan/LPS O-acetylase OafA/YrhL